MNNFSSFGGLPWVINLMLQPGLSWTRGYHSGTESISTIVKGRGSDFLAGAVECAAI